MLLVDEHLAPVLDEQVSVLAGDVLEEGAAEKRAAAPRQLRPLAVGAVEAERLRAPEAGEEGAGGVAAAAGPFFGGAFADLVGIRASFGVTAALLAASAVLISAWVKEERPEEEKSETEEADEAEGPLPHRRLAPSLLALFVVQVAIMSAAPALPGFLSTLMEEPVRVATLAGWIIATGALAGPIGRSTTSDSFSCGRMSAMRGSSRWVTQRPCASTTRRTLASPRRASSRTGSSMPSTAAHAE